MKNKTIPYITILIFILLFILSITKYNKLTNSSISTTRLAQPVSETITEEIESFQANLPETSNLCFTYEELPDHTLRITSYDSSKNLQNPYHVVIPATIDGKPVSTLGNECLGLPDVYSQHMIELTISEGITTLEANLLEYIDEIYLINIPDSVTFIDEKAFQDKDRNTPHTIVIGCNDTSYAYHYALKNKFACHILNPTKPENYFLMEYKTNQSRFFPYYCHYLIEGSIYNYIVIEYLDIERKEWDLYLDRSNEFLVLVQDKDSKQILQCIDSSCLPPEKIDFTFLSGVNYKNFVSFADWNFDGIEDICCYQGYFGTGAVSYSSLFIYNTDSASYLNVPSFCGIDSPQIRPDKKCIYGYSRGAANIHYVNRYEYQDEKLICVAQLTSTVIDHTYVEIIDERLIDEKWQVYRNETFSPRDTSVQEPYLDALEQATVLYKNDGYWDLS